MKLSFKITAIGVITFFVFLTGVESAESMSFSAITETKKSSSVLLKNIYREVLELGKSPGDDFIQRQFFVGEDDDDTNKDIHVFILIQKIDEVEKMTLQITYMQRGKGKPVIQYAKYVKSISCLLAGDKIDIIENDYDEKGIESILPEVLHAIQNKKKLLKIIKTK